MSGNNSNIILNETMQQGYKLLILIKSIAYHYNVLM